MPTSSCLPHEEARTPGQLANPEVPVPIIPIHDAASFWSGVESQAALDALASNKNTLEATGMDRESLHKRLSYAWTAESAFRDCESSLSTPKHVLFTARLFASHGAAVYLRPLAT
jgi:hypothetical protein